MTVMNFEIVNLNDVPDDLPPGQYNTKVLGWSEDYTTLKLEYLGTPYDPVKLSCLIPMTKHPIIGEPFLPSVANGDLVHPFMD